MRDTLCIRLSAEERGALKALAELEERSLADVIRRLIRLEAARRGVAENAAESRLEPAIANPARVAQQAVRERIVDLDD